MDPAPASTVLVIDDDHGMVDTLADILGVHGYTVRVGDSGEQAIAMARSADHLAVLMDVRMPGISGVDALKAIRAHDPDTAVIMMTAYTRDETLGEADLLGALAILPKPLDIDLVLTLLARASAARASGGPP